MEGRAPRVRKGISLYLKSALHCVFCGNYFRAVWVSGALPCPVARRKTPLQ